jgi:uncharacterized membrane protein YjjB (DUF3815 family)
MELRELLIQFLLAAGGTLGFGFLFAIPPKHYLACALDGAVGWVAYEILILLGMTNAMATLLATIPLTLLARFFAIKRKAPVTVFLLCGIFPLVPGAGIYYTAYYFIQGNNWLFTENGINTIKVAVALAVGIAIVLGIPLPTGKAPTKQIGQNGQTG